MDKPQLLRKTDGLGKRQHQLWSDSSFEQQNCCYPQQWRLSHIFPPCGWLLSNLLHKHSRLKLRPEHPEILPLGCPRNQHLYHRRTSLRTNILQGNSLLAYSQQASCPLKRRGILGYVWLRHLLHYKCKQCNPFCSVHREPSLR